MHLFYCHFPGKANGGIGLPLWRQAPVHGCFPLGSFHVCSNPCSASRQLCVLGTLLNLSVSGVLICKRKVIIVPTGIEGIIVRIQRDDAWKAHRPVPTELKHSEVLAIITHPGRAISSP